MKRTSELNWKKVKLVIFDVDGTLYSQPRLRLFIAKDLLKAYLLQPFKIKDLQVIYNFRKLREQHSGHCSANLNDEQFHWCAEKTRKPAEYVKQLVEKWIYKAPLKYLPICTYPGIKDLFAGLKGQGIKIAIYSDYPADEKLNVMGLAADLTVSSTDKEVNCFKPNPAGIDYVCNRFNIPKENTVFIGDRYSKDGMCASHAGVPYVHIPKPFNEAVTTIKMLLKISGTMMISHPGEQSSHVAGHSKAQFSDYVKIARPDNWVKNFFILPGMIFAYVYFKTPFTVGLLTDIIVGFFSACFIASANYVINEFLDIEYDKFHPIKKNRSLVKRHVNCKIIYFEYLLFAAVGILLASTITLKFLGVSVLFLIMGIIYNVPPIRSKDKPYLDVLTESVNNPIRFALGWFIFTPSLGFPDTRWDLDWVNTFPPVSIIIAYWMGGAFLMATKRFAEIRMINDSEVAGLYRRSFRFYNENSLLISMFFYAITCAFFLAIFLAKNRIELIVTFPFFALLFSWYLRIGLLNDSPVQRIKGLHKRKWFVTYLVLFCILFFVLMFVDIPWLHWFLRNSNN